MYMDSASAETLRKCMLDSQFSEGAGDFATLPLLLAAPAAGAGEATQRACGSRPGAGAAPAAPPPADDDEVAPMANYVDESDDDEGDGSGGVGVGDEHPLLHTLRQTDGLNWPRTEHR